MSSVLDESVKKIKADRRASVGESYEYFKQETAKAQTEFGTKLQAEVLAVVEQTQPTLSPDGREKILSLLPKHLDKDLYFKRFPAFEEAVRRHIGRYGQKLDSTLVRSDIVEALYYAGSENFVMSVLAKLSDDLELVVQRKAQSATAPPSASQSKLEQANKLIKLEPNIFGIGLNLNYLIRKFTGRKE